MNPSEAFAKELHRRRYSERTISTYVGCLERFLNYAGKDVNKITKKDVRLYLEKMSEDKKAGNTMNVTLMALKFYFEQILSRKMWVDIKYSKIPIKIQRYLTKEEIIKLIDSIKNLKHQLMICLMYSAGLRVSELINLKVKDLVLENCYGFVRKGKGNKDRVFVIAGNLVNGIKHLLKDENLNDENFLFISNRNKKYSVRSIQKIIKNSAKNSGIEDWKEIHPHTLRHSFATHLIENNYALTDVQASLGHKSPETSLIYAHSSGKMIGIKSPLETLKAA